MNREAIVVGETYAVLHGSRKDRSDARALRVVAKDDTDTHAVYGYLLGVEDVVVRVPVRLIRNTWERWEAGEDRPPITAIRDPKNLAGWLRRIANDPDAGDQLRQAALDQLADLGVAS